MRYGLNGNQTHYQHQNYKPLGLEALPAYPARVPLSSVEEVPHRFLLVKVGTFMIFYVSMHLNFLSLIKFSERIERLGM